MRDHEGFVGRYYLDPVGIPTIGVGMTWRSKAFRNWWSLNRSEKFAPGVRMTKSEADNALLYLFKHEYGKAVNDWLNGKVIAQNEWDCAASMSYNCGPGALKWKWAQALRAGRIAEAAERLRGTAIKARGRRLPGLVRRRKEEALLLEKGIYTGVQGVQREPADAMVDGVLVRGERGPAVKTLIQALAKLGYYDGVIDGVFGYGTEAAVVEFQRDNGLQADGYVGALTFKAIEVAIKAGDRKVDPFAAEAEAREQLEETDDLLDELNKPPLQSKTIWGAIKSYGGNVTGALTSYMVSLGTWFSGLPLWAQLLIAAVIIISFGFGLYGAVQVIRERLKYRGEARIVQRTRRYAQ